MPADRPMKLTLKSQAAIMATVISVMLVSLFGWSQREPIRLDVMAQIKAQQTALVKESADGAKQSAQACQDLSGLALDLQKMVSNFRVGEHGKNKHNIKQN